MLISANKKWAKRIEFIINFITKIRVFTMGCGASQQNIAKVQPLGLDLYERKELIGVGHHGRVYRCLHQTNKQQYALKVIDQLQNQPNYQSFKENYIGMVARLKELQNTKIASYLHLEFNQKQLSIVMEHAKEGTLKKYIQKQGKLPEELVSNIIQQILQGILYLHSKQVLHNDLKSSNILMYENQNIKIADFSIAQLYDVRLTSKNKLKKCDKLFIRGDTLPYMAPEVIKNQGVSQKSDVWSIGCIAIQMLTGKIPWSYINSFFQEAFKVLIKSAYHPIPPSLSKQCSSFLQKCLAINPSKRISVKQLLKHPFIQKNSKKGELSFQLQQNLSTPKLKQNDIANRITNSRNSNVDKQQQTVKTPLSIQKRYLDQNSEDYGSRFVPNKSQSRKNQKASKRLKSNKGSQGKSIEMNRSVGQIGDTKNLSFLSKEQILPQIIEDDQEINVVVLNNKKLKLNSPSNSTYQNHFKTQPTQYQSSKTREGRDSIKLEGGSSTDRLKVIKRNDYTNDINQNINKNQKMETQPSLMTSQLDQSKDFFKKPLKLLKKKINDRKKINPSNSSFGQSLTRQESSNANIQIQKLINQQKRITNNKIRSNTQQRRQQIVINTQLAKAQRDRYINEQVLIKRQREQDKSKWQKQLKKEAEVLKKQLSRRYAYPYTSIPL